MELSVIECIESEVANEEKNTCWGKEQKERNEHAVDLKLTFYKFRSGDDKRVSITGGHTFVQ